MDTLQSFETKFLILQEISGVITTTKDTTTLANLILESAIEYTVAEKGSVMLNNEHDELCILAARGFDMPFIESYKVKVGEDVAGVVVKEKSHVISNPSSSNPAHDSGGH